MIYRLRWVAPTALLILTTSLLLSTPTFAQNRQVRAWGNNSKGQLGNGTASNTNKTTPTQTSNLSNVRQVAT